MNPLNKLTIKFPLTQKEEREERKEREKKEREKKRKRRDSRYDVLFRNVLFESLSLIYKDFIVFLLMWGEVR